MLLAPELEVLDQLVSHPPLDAQQDASQQRLARAFEHLGWNQFEQGGLAHCHRQGGLALQPCCSCREPGAQGQLKIIHQAQPLQFAFAGVQQQLPRCQARAQGDHRMDLQLEHLQVGDGVAVVAGLEGFELAGVEQSPDHPVCLG